MQRIELWEEALHNFIGSRVDMPFEWGVNDCCVFSADAIQSFTGVDIDEEFRGKYTDQGSAIEVMAAAGCDSVEAAADYIAKKFDVAEIPIAFAQRGDMLLFEGEEGQAVGVVYLNGIHGAFVGKDGLYRKRVLDCKKAWAVGREVHHG